MSHENYICFQRLCHFTTQCSCDCHAKKLAIERELNAFDKSISSLITRIDRLEQSNVAEREEIDLKFNMSKGWLENLTCNIGKLFEKVHKLEQSQVEEEKKECEHVFVPQSMNIIAGTIICRKCGKVAYYEA